jgi:hypothetical protein
MTEDYEGDIEESTSMIEFKEQMEEMAKLLKQRGLTEKQIKDLIRPHYRNMKKLNN